MKTPEEILKEWDDDNGGELYCPDSSDLIKLIKMAQAEQRKLDMENEKLTEEQCESLFPNSIKRSTTFGYGMIESQEDFIEEFRKYILDAVKRGAEKQRARDAEIAESNYQGRGINYEEDNYDAGLAHAGASIAKAIREQD